MGQVVSLPIRLHGQPCGVNSYNPSPRPWNYRHLPGVQRAAAAALACMEPVATKLWGSDESQKGVGLSLMLISVIARVKHGSIVLCSSSLVLPLCQGDGT